MDRALLVATVACAIVAVLPLFFTPIVPLPDLPDNIGAAALVFDTQFGHGLPAHHYKLAVAPYWTTYLFMALTAKLFGALVAAKLVVAVTILALPLATMRLLLALGRDLRLGLWAFLLSWEHSLRCGWFSYSLSMSLALVAIAWLVEARTLKDAARVAALSAIVGFTHIMGAMFLGLSALAMALVRQRRLRRVLVHGVGVSGLATVLVPWLAARFGSSGGVSQGLQSFSFEFHPTEQKVASLFDYTLNDFLRADDIGFAALGFMTLAFGPLLLSLLPARRRFDRRVPAALFVVAGVLYFFLPMTTSGPVSHWYTYPRYASFMLLALLLVPAPTLRRRATLALLPGLAAFALMSVGVARQFHAFADRARPFLSIIDAVRPNSSYLPLETDTGDPALKLNPYNQIHAYIAAVKGGYDPHLFDNPSMPLHYRADTRLPQTDWDGAQSFSLEAHGKFYDYVLVQNLANDPVAARLTGTGVHARLAREAGQFRLYEIVRD
jgi:hypothetical protein